MNSTTKYENEMKKTIWKRLYIEQTLANNRMRSMLESEHEQKIKDMNCMQKELKFKISRF